MSKGLKGFIVITVISLAYVLHWEFSDMGLFLPKAYIYSDAAKGIDINASNVPKWNQSLHNDSVTHKGAPSEYTTPQETVSPRVVINEEKREGIQRDSLENLQEDAPIDIEKEKMAKYRSEWESLWRHYVSVDLKTMKAITMEERIRLWRQILEETIHFNATDQTLALNDLYTTFALPQDSVQHYNEDAYNILIESLLDAQKEGRNFTIVASGGSATAGGGSPSIPQEHRYYSKFADYLNSLLFKNSPKGSNPTVQPIGQGHGSRNSLHTAFFFDSFIPVDADLLLWEFSINDVTPDLHDEDLILTSARNNLLSWLYQVKRMKRPPKVILIYKWDPWFTLDEKTNKTICTVFDAHGNLARQFDFVVGHIHVGHYVDELTLPECRIHKSCPLLSDRCHISSVGHLAIAFLLMEFMKNPNVHSRSAAKDGGSMANSLDYRWDCGNQTKTKRALVDTMTITTNSSVEWRSPLGSWTLELPFIENQVTPRRLVAGPAVGTSNLIGKQDPNREDRQRVTPIYLCDMNTSNSFTLIAPVEPMVDVRVVLLNFPLRPLVKRGIELRVNGSITTSKGQLVPLRVRARKEIGKDWRCSLPFAWGNLDIYLYIFEQVQASVHSVELCATSKFNKMPQVQSLTFW